MHEPQQVHAGQGPFRYNPQQLNEVKSSDNRRRGYPGANFVQIPLDAELTNHYPMLIVTQERAVPPPA